MVRITCEIVWPKISRLMRDTVRHSLHMISVYSTTIVEYSSHFMRKPTIYICENKGADQLRSNCEADHVSVFATQIVQTLFFLNFKLLACFCDSTDWFVLDLVSNINCLFSHSAAQNFVLLFFNSFYVPFKIISAHMRRANQ